MEMHTNPHADLSKFTLNVGTNIIFVASKDAFELLKHCMQKIKVKYRC